MLNKHLHILPDVLPFRQGYTLHLSESLFSSAAEFRHLSSYNFKPTFIWCFLNSISQFYFMLCVWAFMLHAYLCTTCVCGSEGVQKSVSTTLRLELQIIEKHHMVAGNWEVSTINCWTIFPDSNFLVFSFIQMLALF